MKRKQRRQEEAQAREVEQEANECSASSESNDEEQRRYEEWRFESNSRLLCFWLPGSRFLVLFEEKSNTSYGKSESG